MTNKMIAPAVTVASVIAMPFGAFAADLGPPIYKAAPQLILPPPFSWSGFYVGVNLGVKSGRFDEFVTATPAFPLGVLGLPSDITTAGVGGGQIGYMWQTHQWVVGVEGDFDGTGLRRTAMAGPAVPPPFVAGDSLTIHNNWQASARGRIGWAWDCALLYATGGASWANLKATADFVPVGVLPGVTNSVDRTLFGWTIGGGFDYGFSGGWSLGAEYRYTRYQSDSNLALAALPIAVATTTPLALSTGLATHEITARLSYHFAAGNMATVPY
jgi:outer membrane immunogenic protein